MKFTSRYALLAALGFGVAAMGVSTPVLAKKEEKAAKKPAPKLSEPVRKQLQAAQEALAKNDFATADTALQAAKAAATTPDEQYFTGQIMLNSAVMSKDTAKQGAALDMMLASGATPAEDQAKFYGFQGHFAYDAKNYAKAEQAYTAAIAAGSTDQDVFARLADVQFRNNKPNDAVATLQKVIDAKAASGQPVPTEWYARGADIASRAKLPNEFVRISTSWLNAYPTKQNWHDTIFIYRQMSGASGDLDLDLLRLARAVGVLPISAQSNYIDYALAVYLKYPNEAVDVLNEGIKAGKLNPQSSQNTREILALSQPKIAPDKASIPAAVSAASKGAFKAAVTAGDLTYGYKDFAKSAEMYKLAVAKPGADAGIANFRLGLALAQAGDKEGAKAAFGAVTTGPYAPLAGYGKVWLDHPAQ